MACFSGSLISSYMMLGLFARRGMLTESWPALKQAALLGSVAGAAIETLPIKVPIRGTKEILMIFSDFSIFPQEFDNLTVPVAASLVAFAALKQ